MAAVQLSTTLFPTLVDLVEKEFIYYLDNYSSGIEQLFKKETFGPGMGSTKRYDEGNDVSKYTRFKAESARSDSASYSTGYSKTMIKRRFSLNTVISYEMRTENKYSDVGARMTNLSKAPRHREWLDLTHRITFATATSYTDMDGETVDTTGGDGLAIISASHTLNGSSVTWSNVITGNPTYSPSALDTALQLANTDIYDNLGNSYDMDFNTVFCANDRVTIKAIKQDLESTADIDASHSGVKNINFNILRLIVIRDLATTATGAIDSAKLKYWGICAAGQWPAYFGVWEAPHMIATQIPDEWTDDLVMGVRHGYGICVVTGKGIMLSTGLGS